MRFAAAIGRTGMGTDRLTEPLPDQTLGLTVRLLALALVICAAALTPPPVEAEAQLP